MLYFVYGGSGSGKSEYAEGLVVDSGLPERLYVATMAVWDEEGRQRVARHRRLRRGKGFRTLERPVDLAGCPCPPGCAVLLEDVTNLLMQEWFDRDRVGAVERVLAGIDHLNRQAALAVVVGNDLFGDGVSFEGEMAQYLAQMARLHREIAQRAEGVVEVVCGLPLVHKSPSEEMFL